MDFRLITNRTILNFEKEVGIYLKNGWELVGGVGKEDGLYFVGMTLDKNTTKLTKQISMGLDRELKRQKRMGKKFISDEDVDTIIDKVISEELGDKV